MNKPKKTRYYTSFDDVFVETPDQNYRLPKNYKWVKDGLSDKISRTIIGSLGRLFARIYGKIFLHIKIVRNVDLSEFKHTGIVVYGNHTQPVGDAFNPLLVCRPKKCYTVASTANLALPVIGKLIPRFILPVPQNTAETRQFLTALYQTCGTISQLIYGIADAVIVFFMDKYVIMHNKKITDDFSR